MIILDGVEITTEEQLEAAIASLSDTAKTSLRNIFFGATDLPPSQYERDYQRYLKRAAARDMIMAEMAS